MRIVATVLVHDNPHGLAEVMRRLGAQTRPPDAVVVLDNASPHPVECPDVDIVVADTNLGVGGGHNAAIRRALEAHDADAVWILEHDTFPEPSCLAALVAAVPSSRCVVVPLLARNHYELGEMEKEGVVAETRFTLNATLVTRSVIDEVGLLDETLFIGQEDWDWSRRMVAAHVPVLRCDDAVALHAHRGSQRFESYISPGRLYYSARNSAHTDRPASALRRSLDWPVAAAKALTELVRPGRGLRYARARWWAHVDGRRGRMGASSRRV